MQQNTAAETVQTLTQFELSNKLFDSNFFEKFKVTASTRILVMALCRYYPNIYPSMETLQKKAGIISKETLNDSLKELKEKGFIIYSVGDKKSNVYKFTAFFFSQLKTVPKQYGFSDVDGTETVHKQTSYKTNKKPFRNFSKFYETDQTKSFLEKNPWLLDEQHSEIIINGYHQYNTAEKDFKTILQIKEMWGFKTAKFDILRHFEQRKQTDMIFRKKIENIEAETKEIFQNIYKSNPEQYAGRVAENATRTEQ